MKTMRRTGLLLGVVAAALLGTPAPAAGYVGPGATLAVIGAAIAVVGAVFVTVGGFLWYPVKRLWKAFRGGKGGAPRGEEETVGGRDESPGDAT